MRRQARAVKACFFGDHEIDGAGVRIIRAFGHKQLPKFNPFLQLDEVRSSEKDNFLRGFPWHPHRGLVTFTYLFEGKMIFEDTGDNRGWISAGDAQVIKAGTGFIHQEMPRSNDEFWGIQLWINAPRIDKQKNAVLENIRSRDVPVYRGNDGLIVKVLTGSFRGYSGGFSIRCLSLFLDIHIPPFGVFSHTLPKGLTVFAYILEGNAHIPHTEEPVHKNHETILYGEGEIVSFTSGDEELRVILCAGTPLDEPVAWFGPIVANSQEELDRAYDEYEKGTFLRLTRGLPVGEENTEHFFGPDVDYRPDLFE